MGPLVAGLGGAALLIVMFALNWYEVNVPEAIPTPPGVDLTFNAWGAFDLIDYGLLAVGVVGIGLGLLAAFRVDAALGPASVVTAAAGSAAVIVIAFRVADPPTLGIGGIAVQEEGGVDITTEIGAFLGLIAVAGIAVGGVLSMRETGTTLGGALRRLEGAFGEDESSQGPPPPRTPAS